MRFLRPRREKQDHRGAGRSRRRWVIVAIVAGILGMNVLLAAPASADSCATAPTPVRPGSGLVGDLDPPSLDHGDPNSFYGQYSYAGTEWNTYDLGTGGICYNPIASFNNEVGTTLFNGAKGLVAATNGVHYLSLSQDGPLRSLDDLVKEVSGILYAGAFMPYLALALLLVVVLTFKHVFSGDLASTSTATARVLIGLWIATATFLTPLVYTSLTDGLITNGAEELEQNMLHQGGVDYRNGLPDLLYTNVIYDNWLTGEFGSTASSDPNIQKLGPQLLDSQAWAKGDVSGTPAQDQAALNAKNAEFQKVATAVQGGEGDYSTFKGTDNVRIGTGFFALIEAICYSLFQLLCLLAVFLAQFILRMVVMCGPAIGLLSFAPGVARTVGRAIGGVMVQGLWVAGAATVDLLAMNWILAHIQGSLAQLMLMSLLTALAYVVIKPFRRLRNMITASVGVAPVSRDQRRLERLLRRQGRAGRPNLFDRMAKAADWWREKGQPYPDGPRPEADTRYRLSDAGSEDLNVYDGEIVPPGAGMVRTGRTRRRAEEGYVNGFAYDTHAPRSRRNPALGPAIPALPRGTGGPGSGGDEAGGAAPSSGKPPGSDPGGAGRSESLPPRGGSPTTRRADPGHRPTPDTTADISDPFVVPSRLEEQDRTNQRWSDAERTEANGPFVVDPVVDEGGEVYRLYRPSTDRFEQDQPSTKDTADRPEGEG